MFWAWEQHKKVRAQLRAEGRAEGVALGWAEGWAEGEALGRAAGRAEGATATTQRYEKWLAKVAEERGIDLSALLTPMKSRNRGRAGSIRRKHQLMFWAWEQHKKALAKIRAESEAVARVKREAAVAREAGNKAVVFGPGKYIGQRDLTAMDITFCQCPTKFTGAGRLMLCFSRLCYGAGPRRRIEP